MKRRLLVSIPMLGLAALILVISVLRTASVKYEFTGAVNGASTQMIEETQIDYYLAYPGKVRPDNPLWTAKALRDKLWLATTTNNARKAELLLLFADKRMAASSDFFREGEAEKGYETLVKAEHYLTLSYDQTKLNVDAGEDVSEFLTRLALASLKHRQVIEEEILPSAPDDAKPEIVHALETTKHIYKMVSQLLLDRGGSVPKNPFDS